MMTQKVWYEEINRVRGLAILLYFFYYAGFLKDGFLGNLEYLNFIAPPTFFFISGLSLTLNYKDNLNLKIFYTKRYQYLVPIYLFWSAIILYLGKGFTFQALFDLFTGVYLFLFILFQLYLIFPVLLKICKKRYGIWLFGIVLSVVSISVILLWTLPSDSPIYRFFFNFVLFKNELITINISRLFYFIPFSIYFILGILVGCNYERFKELLGKYKFIILIQWIFLSIMIPLLIYFFNLIYTGYFNLLGIFFAISSIFFFFLLLYRRNLKFLSINGNISLALYLAPPVVLTIIGLIYMSLSKITFYLGGLFYCITSVIFFLSSYKLWGSKFFYFSKKIAVTIFLVLPVIFTLVLGFISFSLSSTFDYFILFISYWFTAYLVCLTLIALIKKIPHYEYLLTKIRD